MPTLTELTQQAQAGTLVPPAHSPPPQSAPAAPTPLPTSPGFAGAHTGPPGDVAFSPEAAPEQPDAWQAELITARELAQLAARLLKQPSEEKKTLGRALFHAIKGEPFAPQGHRNQTAYKLAGEIIEAYPNADPHTVMACLSAAVSRVRALGSKLTEQTWLSMLERMQAERRDRLNMVKGVAGKLGRALQKQAEKIATPMTPAVGYLLAGQAPVAPEYAAAAAPGAVPALPIDTIIILADGTYYLRHPGEPYYRWRLKTHEALGVELDRQFGVTNSTLITRDMQGEPAPINEIVRMYGTNAHRIVHDYSSALTTWDAATATLHVGLPDAAPEAEPCPRVHAWLTALAGEVSPGADPETNVRDLYDWIASATREHINSPAGGLVIVGRKDAGKSLIALALAATWGTLPVKLSNAVERFNGSLLSSPFWWADERMPDDLTDAKYREMVQERTRLVEPKGREKVELHGCSRIVITLNEPEDLRMGGLEGPAALEAVVDRIAYFDCTTNTIACLDALDALREGPGRRNPHDVDLPRIVRHLRWVQTEWAQTNGAPRPQRFLGTRADKSKARRLVIEQGVTRSNSVLIDALRAYLLDPHAWEKSYHAEERAFATGQRCPCITETGLVWVWPQELATRLQLRGAEAAAMRRALKALRGGPPREITFGNKRLRAHYWPVDLEKLVIAMSVTENSEAWHTLINTCATDTRARVPALRD